MPQWKASLSHQWECPEGRKMGWCAWWQLEACLDPETLLALCEHMLVLLLVNVPFLLEAAKKTKKKTKPKNINTEVPCYRLGHIRKIWSLVENDSNPNVFLQFELQAWQCQGSKKILRFDFCRRHNRGGVELLPPCQIFSSLLVMSHAVSSSPEFIVFFPIIFAVKGNRRAFSYFKKKITTGLRHVIKLALVSQSSTSVSKFYAWNLNFLSKLFSKRDIWCSLQNMYLFQVDLEAV